jgi:hypothetical protein
VSGTFSRFSFGLLIMNIILIITILCMVTFTFDIIALYIYRRPDVYRQQNMQDIDPNSLRLTTSSQNKNENQPEQARLTGHVNE